MAKSAAEQLREFGIELRAILERESAQRREVEFLRSHADKQRDELAELRLELAAARQEIALLRQRQDEQQKRSEEWGRRGWTFAMLLVGAVLSLASGLIVTLARK